MMVEKKSSRGMRTMVAILAGGILLAGCGGPSQGDGPAPGSAPAESGTPPEAGAPSGGAAVETAPAAEAAIAVDNPWARPRKATGEMGETSAVYFVLRNTGGRDDALVGAETEVAGKAEIHETIPVEVPAGGAMGGMGGKTGGHAMKMRPVDKVSLPAGGSVEFRPGGLHVMLLDLKGGLGVGDRFHLTLKFEKSAQSIEVVVREP